MSWDSDELDLEDFDDFFDLEDFDDFFDLDSFDCSLDLNNFLDSNPYSSPPSTLAVSLDIDELSDDEDELESEELLLIDL